MKGNFVYKRLGENIIKTRRSFDLSQEDLSLLSHVDRTYLGKLEQGKANPTLRVMVKLSRVLKLHISDLVQGISILVIVNSLNIYSFYDLFDEYIS